MKVVHIVIFWGSFKILSVDSILNMQYTVYTIHDVPHIHYLCQVYVFSVLELNKINNSASKKLGQISRATSLSEDEAKRRKKNKGRNNSHDIFFRKWCLFQRCFFFGLFLTSLTNLHCHLQLGMFGSNEAVSRERFFMQIKNPQI